jgi:hypothetical protein
LLTTLWLDQASFRIEPGSIRIRNGPHEGAGDEARTRDPYLGKVPVAICIRGGESGLKTTTYPQLPRGSTLTIRASTLTTRASTLVTIKGRGRGREVRGPRTRVLNAGGKPSCAGLITQTDDAAVGCAPVLGLDAHMGALTALREIGAEPRRPQAPPGVGGTSGTERSESLTCWPFRGSPLCRQSSTSNSASGRNGRAIV